MQQFDSNLSKIFHYRQPMLNDLRSSRARSKVRSIDRDHSQDKDPNLDQSVENLFNDWNIQKMRSIGSFKQNLSLSHISETRVIAPQMVQSICQIIEEMPEIYNEPVVLVSTRSNNCQKVSIDQSMPVSYGEFKKPAKKNNVLQKQAQLVKSHKIINLQNKSYIKQKSHILSKIIQPNNKIQKQITTKCLGKENQDKSMSRGSFRLEKTRDSLNETDDVILILRKAKQQTNNLLEQKGQHQELQQINKYFDLIFGIIK